MRRRAAQLTESIPGKILFAALILLLFLPPFGCEEGYYYGPYPGLAFLNPLHSEDTIVNEPGLVGIWKGSSEDGVWKFSAMKGGMGYRLVITIAADEERSIIIPFTARLVSLGGQRYLDMELDEGGLDLDGRYLELFLPTHWFHRVDGMGESLVLAPVDVEDGLREYLLDHPGELDFIFTRPLRGPGEPLSQDAGDEEESSAVLVTATTADLQRFMLDHHGDEEIDLFGDPVELERVEEGAKDLPLPDETGEREGVEPVQNRADYFKRAEVYLSNGDYQRAIAEFGKLIEQEPANAYNYERRASVYIKSGDYGSAINDLSAAIELAPKNPAAYNWKAWILATCRDAGYRNGGVAVELAKKAVRLMPAPNYLDTLAAAYAETARFDDAVTTQEEAIVLLVKWRGMPTVLADGMIEMERLEEHLKAFQTGRPWRE